MLRYGLAALAAMLVGGTAQAADSPSDVVTRHMAAFNKGDLPAMMADYADDAVVLQSGAAVQGKAAIQGLFARIAAPPAGGAPRLQLTTTKLWQEGDVGFVTWTAGAIGGTDQFLVRGGKIVVQVVFMSGAPTPPPPPRP
jgi:ketosteroid isomerase-like protein